MQGRYDKLKSMPFLSWKPIDNGGDIPFHKIAQFKYNGLILWNRQLRIDNLNKHSGKTTLDLTTIQQSVNKDIDHHSSSSGLTSEYVEDKEFLSLLLRKSKKMSILYDALDKVINNVFVTQRPNEIETFSRCLCVKYLSFIETFQTCKYSLFGSFALSLDTHKSDIDIKIMPKSKIKDRNECIQILETMKEQFIKTKALRFTSLENAKNSGSKYINITKKNFEKSDHKIISKKMKNISNECAAKVIIIKVSEIKISDAVIPRCVILFDVNAQNKKFEICMDVTVGFTKFDCENMRDLHLSNWMHRHSDLRIHKFLFCVKLWAQYFDINSSVNSTMNGYAWIHIALFFLTKHYKKKHENHQNDDKKYECIYSDIEILDGIKCSDLFIGFIQMLFLWICGFDKSKRKGMNVLNGEWINNPKHYALFVLDPFYSSHDHNISNSDNLCKCVRDKKGIPLIMNAIESSVQSLQFAADFCCHKAHFNEIDNCHKADSAIQQQNEEAIAKCFEFFGDNVREFDKNKINDNDHNDKDECKKEEMQRFTLTELEHLKLNIPKREWIQKCNEKVKFTDNLIICQFNCLAQSLCNGEGPHYTFKTDAKYLKWSYRRKRILFEILQYKPDIICLCEVDKIHFDTFFYPNLTHNGYDGLFLKKNEPKKHKNTTKNKSKHQRRYRSPEDGVAIFWNVSKLSCYDKFECVLGKLEKAYHIALGVRLKYKFIDGTLREFDVWCSHFKAGRNNKAEQWRLSQLNVLFECMKLHSMNKPILFCGDVNAHFDDLINSEGELVKSKLYSAFLKGIDENEHSLTFESVWNDSMQNTFSTWAGWQDREVKCCLDYIMIGKWHNKESDLFKVCDVLKVLDEDEIKKFECRLPNKVYPSDHILIAAKLTVHQTKMP